MFYLLVLLLGRSLEFLGSGGVTRVVTGPWVCREWGPVQLRDFLLGVLQTPSLRPSMARSRRLLPIGAFFGTIRGVYREWWCRTGRRDARGSVVTRGPSGSVIPPEGPSRPLSEAVYG